jgi:hypothetical protein
MGAFDMPRITKSLLVAAALVAITMPAQADPNTLPAFRAITAYTLYRQVLLCEPAYVRHAEILAKAVADRAKEDQPSLNLERSWRLAWMDPTGYPLPFASSTGECQAIVSRLELILSAGKVM